MEPQKTSTLLADLWNTMQFEPEKEEYILTPEDEQKILSHAKSEALKHLEWRMKKSLFTDEQILAKAKSINWNEEIDRELILAQGNSNKHYGIWQQQQREKDKQDAIRKVSELKEKWNAKEVFKFMKWTSLNSYDKTLIVHDDNRRLITALCFFISGDPRFETDLGYSFKKGLLIRGISGLGKTFLVKCIAKNELNPILILSMLEISDEIKEHGEYDLNPGENKIVYLDDVGTEEPTINHFGTKINYFKNFVELIYLRNNFFNKLILSTNNSFSEMEEKYGFRVRSRIKDMFNIVDVKGKDMRG